MKILGITACTAGVAHTYMAQDAIIQEAKRRGFDVKVETQGMMGIENEIEPEDLAGAQLLIVAADIGVENMDRFTDIPTYECGTNDVIAHITDIFDAALKLVN